MCILSKILFEMSQNKFFYFAIYMTTKNKQDNNVLQEKILNNKGYV